MPLPRHQAKRDANEAEIIEALTAVGASVVQLSQRGVPDLLVGYRGATYLLEVKTKTGDYTEDQVKFNETWRGQRALVRTPEDALYTIGAL